MVKSNSFIHIICSTEIYMWITRVLQEGLWMVTERWMHSWYYFFTKAKPSHCQIIGLLSGMGSFACLPFGCHLCYKERQPSGKEGKLFCGPVSIKNLQTSLPLEKRLQFSEQIQQKTRELQTCWYLIENKRSHYPIVKSGSIYNVRERFTLFK